VKRELQYLLRTPLVMAEYGGSYPTMMGKLPDPILQPLQPATAVESLQNNIMQTKNMLKTRKQPRKDKKFKGFKKKKSQSL
jgi:hypothetical protein